MCLFVGNHEKPLEEVQPAFPEAMTSEKPDIKPTATSSGRRTALADWLVSEKNPLTARVFVNRVWNQYFGKGIVGTVSDFGKAGDKPTNQELLDYLASTFVQDGWSVKKLHRAHSSLLHLSSVVRTIATRSPRPIPRTSWSPSSRASGSRPRKFATRSSSRRASSTSRSAVRACSRPFRPISPGAATSTMIRPGRTAKDPKDFTRRSLYIFTRRSLPYPLLETFDMANSAADPQQARRDHDAAAGADALQQRHRVPMVAGARRTRHRRGRRRRIGADRSALSRAVQPQAFGRGALGSARLPRSPSRDDRRPRRKTASSRWPCRS